MKAFNKPSRKIISTLLLILAVGISAASAQQLPTSITQLLKAKEDSLRDYAEYLNTDSLTADRMISDSSFTKTLVRALAIKNSFYYPFDSIKGINKIYAPDTSFRIITWNINYSDYYSRQRGAIQIRTTDGSLKLFPLRDVSEFTDNTQDSIRTPRNWIGAMYYNMVMKEFKGKKYYTLFGFDNNNAMSSLKWIEVLWFNEKKEPQFGGPFFSYERDSVNRPPLYRFQIEFKKGASILVNYDADMDLILVDHLVSENNDPDHKWTYVPDGDQEGFKWENGKWIHINKVFNQRLQDGQAPIEKPVYNKENENAVKKPKGNK